MRNARLQRYPPPPETLRDLTEILQDPRYSVITLSQDGQDNIYGGSVDDADGEHHILFISQRMVEKCREFSVLHADGTFKSVPVGLHFAAQVFLILSHYNISFISVYYVKICLSFLQVFCIVAEWDHTIIPLAWSLMSRKTENAYTAVLSLLLHLMGNEFDLERVITDFEAGNWIGFGFYVICLRRTRRKPENLDYENCLLATSCYLILNSLLHVNS